MTTRVQHSTEERTDIATLLGGYFAQTIQDGPMSFMITVRKVETRYIHTSIHQGRQSFFRPTGRSNRTDNLGTTGFHIGGSFDRFQVDKGTGEGRNFARVGDHG